MDLSLTGKTAIIGGSTQGIGLAIAHELATNGANCILLARDKDALERIAASLPASGGQKHNYRVADFSEPAQVKAAVDSIVKEHPVQILVNNTGGPKPGPAIAAQPDEFVKAFEQHLVNNQQLVQAVVPGMKQEGYGRIVNIISTSVRIPLNNLGVSNTIRSAVAAWAKTLANELGAFKITVNNILPGLTDTQRLQGLIESIATSRGLAIDIVSKSMIDSIPAKRFGAATEIANVVAFLVSPAASYVNGVSLPVDGGRTGSI